MQTPGLAAQTETDQLAGAPGATTATSSTTLSATRPATNAPARTPPGPMTRARSGTMEKTPPLTTTPTRCRSTPTAAAAPPTAAERVLPAPTSRRALVYNDEGAAPGGRGRSRSWANSAGSGRSSSGAPDRLARRLSRFSFRRPAEGDDDHRPHDDDHRPHDHRHWLDGALRFVTLGSSL